MSRHIQQERRRRTAITLSPKLHLHDDRPTTTLSRHAQDWASKTTRPHPLHAHGHPGAEDRHFTNNTRTHFSLCAETCAVFHDGQNHRQTHNTSGWQSRWCEHVFGPSPVSRGTLCSLASADPSRAWLPPLSHTHTKHSHHGQSGVGAVPCIAGRVGHLLSPLYLARCMAMSIVCSSWPHLARRSSA